MIVFILNAFNIPMMGFYLPANQFPTRSAQKSDNIPDIPQPIHTNPKRKENE
jgi:hypothetical protein